MAMFTRAHALRAIEALTDLQTVIVRVAEAHLDWAMPGYTHLQRAQPVYLSHHLLAYFWMFRRDARAVRGRAGLDGGAAAGLGRAGGRELPHRPAPGGLASSGSRAWCRTRSTASPTATSSWTSSSAAATCATHLSRLGAEIVLWSSEEFGFAEVRDDWASSSSIMPQKKNPDAAELLRAKAPRIVAHLAGAARRDARPPADLQQGHAGGQGAPLRRRRHAGAVPGGGARDARGHHLQARPAGRRRDRRDARRGRRRRHARQARRAVPPVARDRRGAGARRRSSRAGCSRSSRARSSPQHSDVLDDDFYAVLSQGSWLESKESEGGTSLARVREQLAHARAAARWTRRDASRVASTTGPCWRSRPTCSAASSCTATARA